MSIELTYFNINRCLCIAFISISISTLGQATMDVTDEPFHQPVYQSDEFTLINLQMENGDTSLFHMHSDPILYITLGGANMWLDEQGGTPRSVNLPDGWIGSDAYSHAEPFVHRIAVIDEGPLHLIAVLRKKTSRKTDFQVSNYTFLENGFAVNVDSTLHSSLKDEKINIIVSGSALVGKDQLHSGDFFLPDQLPLKPTDDFKYCSVYF